MCKEAVIESCPQCGAELEKTSWTEENETVFVDNCPNCSYRKKF